MGGAVDSLIWAMTRLANQPKIRQVRAGWSARISPAAISQATKTHDSGDEDRDKSEPGGRLIEEMSEINRG